MIELNGIVKSFQDGDNRINQVLRGLDLHIDKGEFVAIKGQSGAGKTTLLNILGTLLMPDEGTYTLDGICLTNQGVDLPTVRNEKIGFVFQDHRLLPQFTAIQNILLPTLASHKQSSEDQLEYALELMRLTHIEHLAQQYPSTLSGGEASRVAVCRALVMKPALLLADEPTGQLDSENAHDVARLLADINGKLHTTIMMVTHSDETSSVANRVLLLKDGILQ
ncbi:MAG: ABC transporter ATP-binding protein [Bacteroidaceae bacterium]|nr:ABC transporter ATP-binding protein [Bacteroidaceae bacterium]